MQCHTIPCSARQYITSLYNTEQHNTRQRSTTQHNTMRYSSRTCRAGILECWWDSHSPKKTTPTKHEETVRLDVCLLVGCLTSQQQASVSQGRICSDNFTRCHTEIEVADPTFYLTQSQYTDTGPTSPSADPITPGAWQGSHWSPPQKYSTGRRVV